LTIRNLEHLLNPASVALVGASPEEARVGNKIAHSLISEGFAGPCYFVNPKYKEVLGRPCYKDIASLPAAPDLAVIATPPATVPGLIAELGAKGTRAAVVVTAGFSGLRQQLLDAAKPYCLRIQGPNVLGLMLPHIGFNASFSHRGAPKGDLAFLSQSGALITGIVDWAAARDIGFSHVVSLGDMLDVDFGDMLDYLAGDTLSRAILIYMEALTNAPKFISAARRAARVKPVIVVKSGRHAAGAKAAMSHTGALAGSDAAYTAAFRRTGLLRVKTMPDLFAAAEMLARAPRLTGERLAIVTNGGGAGVLAADELQDFGGTLAPLDDATRSRLDKVLPPTWSHGNPVDMIGDAGPDRYAATVTEIMADQSTDAVLIMQCPNALASSTENANAVIGALDAVKKQGRYVKPVITCWLGDEAAKEARTRFARERIPTFETPEDAVSGYMQLVRHARAQTELAAMPGAPIHETGIDAAAAKRVITEALAAGRTVLTAIEAQAVLEASGIPIAKPLVAADAADVVAKARTVLASHAACVIKILSRDISHKSDVGGVRLGIESAAAAGIAAQEMLARVALVRPQAKIDGFMVEPMIRRPNAHETIVGVTDDQTFGPMILFGAGGTAVEVVGDRALSLLPLDTHLAEQLIRETRISRLLAGYRDRPAADVAAIAATLVRVSQMVVRHPEIAELDINPLLADENGVLALDARIRIADPAKPGARRPLAIRPYPSQYETTIEGIGKLGPIDVRPVRPEDELLYEKFFSKVTQDDMRLRFFAPRTNLSHKFLARLTQIDYAREMAFVAIHRATGDLIGVVRLILDPDLVSGEYAILLRSDLKGIGLGWRLMKTLIDYAGAEGVQSITGTVLSMNTTMLDMARELGFVVRPIAGDASVVEVVLTIKPESRG
jgi:acetyltransferase